MIDRIVRNTVALFLAQVAIITQGLLLSILIARNLGDVVFGRYSFAIAFVTILAIVLDLGYNTLLIREVARDETKASQYLNNVIGMRIILSIVLLVFISFISKIMAYPDEIKFILYLFGIAIFIQSISDVFSVTFRAFQQMHYESFNRILSSIIRLSLGAMVLLLGYGLIAMGIVFIITNIIQLTINYLICKNKFVKPSFESDLNFWIKSSKAAIPLCLVSVFALLYARVDIIMLSTMKGDAVVGWYSAAYNLITGFRAFPEIFMNVLFPLLSSYSVSSIDSLKLLFQKSFAYLFMLGLPMSIGIVSLANRFIILFYGEQFLPSTIALQILGFEILLIFMYICLEFILISMNYQSKVVIISGSMALLNILLNFYLIPIYSYIGAAVTTLITETFLFAIYFYFVYVKLQTLNFMIFIKSIIACIGMAVYIQIFYELNLLLLVLSSAIVYLSLLIVLKTFSTEDKNLFKRATHIHNK